MRLRPQLTQLRPELMAFAMSLTFDHAAAEDLVHEAILRALESCAAPRAPGQLKPWMFRVVRNLFIDRLRRERTVREFLKDDAAGRFVAGADPKEPFETVLVRQALARLAPRERQVLALVDILGLSYKEAAEVIGIPIGTVMSRISSARRAMLAALGESNVRPMPRRKT